MYPYFIHFLSNILPHYILWMAFSVGKQDKCSSLTYATFVGLCQYSKWKIDFNRFRLLIFCCSFYKIFFSSFVCFLAYYVQPLPYTYFTVVSSSFFFYWFSRVPFFEFEFFTVKLDNCKRLFVVMADVLNYHRTTPNIIDSVHQVDYERNYHWKREKALSLSLATKFVCKNIYI